MAYFNNGYVSNGAYPGMYQQMQNSYQSALYSQQRTEIVRVNGKEGVNAYQMPPNSEVLLLDTTAPIVWLKQTDGAGYATSKPYSITPYEETVKPQESEKLMLLDQRITKIEERLNNTHESNSKSTKHKPFNTTNSAG